MDDLGLFDDAERDDVDQTVIVESAVEVHVAGEIWNADRVSVRADPVDRASAT